MTPLVLALSSLVAGDGLMAARTAPAASCPGGSSIRISQSVWAVYWFSVNGTNAVAR